MLLRDRNALEERREMLEPQAAGDLVDPRLARGAFEGDRAPQLGQRRARLRGPLNVFEPLARAAYRQVMADDAERKVIQDEIRTRNRRQQHGTHEAEAVEREPELVLVEIASELLPHPRRRIGSVDIVGMKQSRRGLTPQVPEEPLFGDAFGDPPHAASARTRQHSTLRFVGAPLPALALRLGEHRLESFFQPMDPSARARSVRLERRVGHLAVQLIAICADGDQKYVHGLNYDSIPDMAPPLSSLELAERLILAATLGAALGFERELRQKSAGLRTNILIAVGSAVFTLMSLAMANIAGTDPTRIAAQIVTGIGFLGAGAIMRTGSGVQGLTTAATVWVNAAVGLAAGGGEYSLALLGTGVTLLALLVLPPVERWIDRYGVRKGLTRDDRDGAPTDV